MTDVSNLRLVLAQTKMVERLQEGTRREGEIEQQETTRRLADKVDIQGRQVDETPESREAKVDPEEKGEEQNGREGAETGEGAGGGEAAAGDEGEDQRQDDPADADGLPDSLAEEEAKGRVIDVKA